MLSDVTHPRHAPLRSYYDVPPVMDGLPMRAGYLLYLMNKLRKRKSGSSRSSRSFACVSHPDIPGFQFQTYAIKKINKNHHF